MNTECSVESAREANRENCEQRDRQRAKTGVVARVTRARQRPETAPTLGLRAKKIPTDKRWDFKYWWWGAIPRQTAPVQAIMPAANGCGKVRNLPVTVMNGSKSRRFGRQHVPRDRRPVRFPYTEMNPRPQIWLSPLQTGHLTTSHIGSFAAFMRSN